MVVEEMLDFETCLDVALPTELPSQNASANLNAGSALHNATDQAARMTFIASDAVPSMRTSSRRWGQSRIRWASLVRRYHRIFKPRRGATAQMVSSHDRCMRTI